MYEDFEDNHNLEDSRGGHVKAYYRTPTDIAYYFRDKESISKLLNFIIDEAEEFSDIIDSNGMQIPYPIFYSFDVYKYQIDYQFYVHCLAKYVAILTGDMRNYWAIINAFGINKSIHDAESLSVNNRLFLLNLHEKMNHIFDVNSIHKGVKYKVDGFLKGFYYKIFGKDKHKVSTHDLLDFCTPVLYKFKESLVEFKAISFANSDTAHTKYFDGIELYIGKKWKQARERYKQSVILHDMKQVAFGGPHIKDYLNKTREKKFIYFFLDSFNIKSKNVYVDYHLASQIDKKNMVNSDDEE